MEKWLYPKCRVVGKRMNILTIIPILNPQNSFFNNTMTALDVQKVKSSIELLIRTCF